MDKAEMARGLAEPLADSDCPPEAVVALAMVDLRGPHSHLRLTLMVMVMKIPVDGSHCVELAGGCLQHASPCNLDPICP